MNTLPSEQAAIAAVINPDDNAVGALDSDWVSMRDFEAIMAVALAGTLGTAATLDLKLQQATDSSGASAKDIPGKAITQLTQADTDDSDKQAVINCRREELDDGFDHVRCVLSTGTEDSGGAAFILGMNPRHEPASDYDLDSVVEIVS